MVPTMSPINPNVNRTLGKRKKKEEQQKCKNSYLKRRKERTLKCKISKMNLILSVITDK